LVIKESSQGILHQPRNAAASQSITISATAARKRGTRDSLQVAVALALKTEVFYTFDVKQAKLAASEGLSVPQASFFSNFSACAAQPKIRADALS